MNGGTQFVGRIFTSQLRLRRGRAAQALAVGLMAALAVSGTANAGFSGGIRHGLAYPTPSTISLPDDSDTGDGVTGDSVGCPGNYPHPVGGGISIQGADPGLDLEVHTSAPSATGWSTVGNNNAGHTAQMTTFAICAKGTYLYPHKSVTIHPNASKTVKVSCPAGTRVIGGGATVVGGDHTGELRASEPADGNDANHGIDDAWFAAASNSFGSDVKLKVTAICDGSSHTYKIKQHAPVLLTTGHQNSSTVFCPSGTQLVGGGADVSGSSSHMELGQMFPVDGPDADSLPDDGFRATGYNDGDAGTRQLVTIAICRNI